MGTAERARVASLLRAVDAPAGSVRVEDIAKHDLGWAELTALVILAKDVRVGHWRLCAVPGPVAEAQMRTQETTLGALMIGIAGFALMRVKEGSPMSLHAAEVNTSARIVLP